MLTNPTSKNSSNHQPELNNVCGAITDIIILSNPDII